MGIPPRAQPCRTPAFSDALDRNPIDAFLLAKMKETGLRPNPPADRATLIRRATLDLHGLPPTPEEVEQFVNDRSPDAWEKVVDRLLASPRYGERWARHWLDLARYAESRRVQSGRDPAQRLALPRLRDPEPSMRTSPTTGSWRSRSPETRSDPGNPEALVATGFCRHWADESNARNIPLRRQEILNDITDTVGSVFLGLTVGCARCHDHKYDPIPQKDYYRLQAFFAAAQPRDDIPLVPMEQFEEHRRRTAEWEEKTREVRERLAALEKPYRDRLMKGKRALFPPEVQDAIDTPAPKRTALQWQLFLKVEPQVSLKDEDLGKAMKGEDRGSGTSLRAEMDQFAPLKPPTVPVAIGITDVGPEAPEAFTLAVGVYDRPVEEVQPGFLSAVHARPPTIAPPTGAPSTGRRTALARWLASPDNPLTGACHGEPRLAGTFRKGSRRLGERLRQDR